MTMTRRRLLDDTFKKSVVGNPAIATDSLARRYPGITMQGWTTQDGTPTPEAPVPIISAGTQNQETWKWEYEITITNAQTDPDKNQTVTLTADRPLTKWDKLEKRGGQWGWVYKSEIKKLTSSNDIRNIGAYYSTYDIQKADENLLINSLSTHFRYAQLPKNDGVFWIDVNGTRLCFTHKNITNLDEIKSWLESELVVFEYPLLEETFVTLSASEQEQMNELHTFHPTTVLSNDAGCEMSLTYKTKKSLEVTT